MNDTRARLSVKDAERLSVKLLRAGIEFVVSEFDGDHVMLASPRGGRLITQFKLVPDREWSHFDACPCGNIKKIKAARCSECHKAAQAKQRKHSRYDAPMLYSPADASLVDAYHWHQSVTGYYYRIEKRKGINRRIAFHREIMNPPPNMVVDHINRNRADNRRENLRIVTSKQNAQNRPTLVGRSGVPNVHRIIAHGKVRYRAYDVKRKKAIFPLFGRPDGAAQLLRDREVTA